MADPTITFKERWFTAFDLDLKRIRLRDELPKICESPDIYNRAKVPLEVFEALHRLFRMRSSMRLRHLLDNNLFPTAKMLLRLESKYGEAISLEDMDGASGFIDPNATLADDDSEDEDDLTEIDPNEQQQNLADSGKKVSAWIRCGLASSFFVLCTTPFLKQTKNLMANITAFFFPLGNVPKEVTAIARR